MRLYDVMGTCRFLQKAKRHSAAADTNSLFTCRKNQGKSQAILWLRHKVWAAVDHGQ